MKVYISGKVSGMEVEATKLFKKAEEDIKALGLIPVNPMTLNHIHDKSWSSYMKEDLKALLECDAIYLLPNWNQSKGAAIEHNIAVWLGIKVYTPETLPLFDTMWFNTPTNA